MLARAFQKSAFIQPNLRWHYVYTSEAGGLHMNHALSCVNQTLFYVRVKEIVEISKSQRIKDHLYLLVSFYNFVHVVCKNNQKFAIH